MITSKQTRCNRWCWAYISRYPHVTTRELMGATTDYSAIEVERAVLALSRLGYIEGDSQRRGWVAAVPFVVSAPAWAR
jgi:hypothetical protein